MQDRGERLSPSVEEQLCFEMKTILLAGHETSAAMLTWTLLELTRNPDCMQKVLLLMHCFLHHLKCMYLSCKTCTCDL